MLQPKNYRVLYSRDGKLMVCIIHVRGLSYKSMHASAYVNGDRLAEYARRMTRGEPETGAVAVPQFQLSVYNDARQVQTRMYTKRFAPPRTHKRVIITGTENELTQTVPFGYAFVR
jgi:hypothetical protein